MYSNAILGTLHPQMETTLKIVNNSVCSVLEARDNRIGFHSIDQDGKTSLIRLGKSGEDERVPNPVLLPPTGNHVISHSGSVVISLTETGHILLTKLRITSSAIYTKELAHATCMVHDVAVRGKRQDPVIIASDSSKTALFLLSALSDKKCVPHVPIYKARLARFDASGSKIAVIDVAGAIIILSCLQLHEIRVMSRITTYCDSHHFSAIHSHPNIQRYWTITAHPISRMLSASSVTDILVLDLQSSDKMFTSKRALVGIDTSVALVVRKSSTATCIYYYDEYKEMWRMLQGASGTAYQGIPGFLSMDTMLVPANGGVISNIIHPDIRVAS